MHGASCKRTNTKHTREERGGGLLSQYFIVSPARPVTPQTTHNTVPRGDCIHTSVSSPVFVASLGVTSPRDELGLGGAVVESENSVSLPTSMPGGFTRKQ